MRIPEEFIALLREKVDIVDVVSEYVRLKRSGRSYVGLCPFHSEKTPSFHVTPGKGFYYCFGCGAGGTAITFLMEMEQLTFYQATNQLAEKYHLTMPAVIDDSQPGDGGLRKNLLAIHELAAKYYNHILMNLDVGMQGLSYFLNRGLTKKTMAQFQLGYAPNEERLLTNFLLKRGFSADDLMMSGVAHVGVTGELRDRYRQRVMFPIWDLQGRVIGFGARTLGDEQPKYLNTSETELFHKGRILYGIAKARQKIRQTGQVILLEGYMDVISFNKHGITNAVAGLGTALTPEQAGLIKRVGEEALLLYDGDAAGQKAAMRSLQVLKEVGIDVRVVELPNGKDPDEWIRENGAEAWQELVDKGKRALAYQLSQLTHEHPEHMGRGRIGYIRDAIVVIAKEGSSIEREVALESLSKTYNMPISALREDLLKQLAAQQRKQAADKTGKSWNTLSRIPAIKDNEPPLPVDNKIIISEKRLLTYMLLDVEVAKQVQQQLKNEFSVPIHSALQAYLYQFYMDHDKPDPELFLNFLDDPNLLGFTTGLLQAASDEGMDTRHSQQEIDDYIQCLIGGEIEKSMQEVVEKLKMATERGEVEEMRQLGNQLLILRTKWSEINRHVVRLGVFQE